jgi:hypothetical protein
MTLIWGSVSMGMGELLRALDELKTTIEELLIIMDNIVKACFRWFFKLHQNSLLLLVRW